LNGSVQNSSPLPRAHVSARYCETCSTEQAAFAPLYQSHCQHDGHGRSASHSSAGRGEKATAITLILRQTSARHPLSAHPSCMLIGSRCAACRIVHCHTLAFRPSYVNDLGCMPVYCARKECLSVRYRRHGVRGKLVPKRWPPREALGCCTDQIQETACVHTSSSLREIFCPAVFGHSTAWLSSAKRKVDGTRGVPEPLQRHHRTVIATRVSPWVGLAGTAIVRSAARKFHCVKSSEESLAIRPWRWTSQTTGIDLCLAVITVELLTRSSGVELRGRRCCSLQPAFLLSVYIYRPAAAGLPPISAVHIWI